MIWSLAIALCFAADPETAPADVDPAVEMLVSRYTVAHAIPEEEARQLATEILRMERQFTWQTGQIALLEGAVTLQLREGDRYLDPTGTATVLEQWGNPPGQQTEGLILPADARLFGPESWAVVVGWDSDGWIDDADAQTIDYDELLAEMKENVAAGAVERREMGLSGLTLDGWAEQPHYDASHNVLYWARSLRDDSGQSTLNYEVRVLGRRGVLSLNALADVADLGRIRTAMEGVRASATFNEGHRYADYTPGVDKKAAYGIAALIGGGAIAAKTGLFKGLLVALLASKKLLIVGFVAVVGAFRAFWGRLTGSARASDPS